MEKTYKFTRKKLIEAFQEWNDEYLADPDNHMGINEPECSQKQADYIIEKLAE